MDGARRRLRSGPLSIEQARQPDAFRVCALCLASGAQVTRNTLGEKTGGFGDPAYRPVRGSVRKLSCRRPRTPRSRSRRRPACLVRPRPERSWRRMCARGCWALAALRTARPSSGGGSIRSPSDRAGGQSGRGAPIPCIGTRRVLGFRHSCAGLLRGRDRDDPRGRARACARTDAECPPGRAAGPAVARRSGCLRPGRGCRGACVGRRHRSDDVRVHQLHGHRGGSRRGCRDRCMGGVDAHGRGAARAAAGAVSHLTIAST